ncbi:MAG: hypothetical protein U0229_03540 [Anaeromyxobacter sp.]
MRRTALLLTALVAATACGSRQKAGSAGAPGRSDPAPAKAIVPKGMEPVPGEQVTSYDLTREGKPDAWKFVVKGPDGQEHIVRKEKDLNGDGKIDAWEKYNDDGSLAVLVYDFDFDGKPDATLYFEKDQLVKKDLAFGFDGVPRTFAYYEKGKLVRKERDTTGDGKVDTWEYWENGELDRIGVDVDGDGQVDRWETKHKDDDKAESASAPAAPAAPSPAAKTK